MKLENIKYMLMAQDMKRAIGFYTKAIGLTVKFESEMWTELLWENSTVALHGGGSGHPNRTGLSFQVTQIHRATEELRAAGATILNGPVDREDEPIILLEVRDPEGNEIMFSQYKGDHSRTE